MSSPFSYAGAQYYQRNENEKYLRLVDQTGIQLEAASTRRFHREGWKKSKWPECR